LHNLKQKIHTLCHSYVEERITAATQAIRASQASANEETKSSAGDKYETGRAMAQLEIEKNSTQLAEAHKLKQILSQISPDNTAETVQSGSLVITTQGNFYIAIAAGQFIIEGEIYYAISLASPIAHKLLGLRTGDQLTFNKKEFVIKQVS
jgi:transcription elongation GreA/GreB family factor